MKLFGKKIGSCVLAAALGLCITFGTEAAPRSEIGSISVKRDGSDFRYWSEDARAYREIRDYVKDVTDPASDNYIPREDRLAVFDMDGTLFCETAPYYFDGMLYLERTLNDKDYEPSEDDREFALQLHRYIYDREPGDKLASSAPHQASIFAGMTYPEFTAYVRNFMNRPVEGLKRLKWGEAVYLPMVEIVKYLQANAFQVYVVSGTDRQMVRILLCDLLDIPESHVIGTDTEIPASGQGDTEPLDYAYQKDDHPIRGAFIRKNLQMNKVSSILRETGKQPVLAFGNSSGDQSMLNFTVNGNKYRSAAFFVLCDDLTRELGNTGKAEKCRKLAEDSGWIPISMRDDFRTIYGDNVVRTDR